MAAPLTIIRNCAVLWPINFEASYDDIVIEGTVPPDLSGCCIG